MYRVYRNQAATSYLCLISLFFFLSNVQKLKIFVTLFSGTVRPRKFKFVRPRKFKLGGQMYHVYQNQASSLLFLPFFFL